LGGPGTRPAAVDALAARTLVKGEPLSPPPGRADDFAWPRREVGREQAKGDTPVAATTPGQGTPAAPGAAAAAPQKPQLQQKKPVQPAQTHQPFGNFFGFGNQAPPRQFAPPPPRSPFAPGLIRPPAPVGRSAAVPGNPTR